MNITFIGGGNMGEAFIASLCKNKIFNPSKIRVIEKNVERNKYLSKKYKIKTSTDINKINSSKIIFLAIKPQNLKNLPTFNFKKSSIIISILAGTKISKISHKFSNTKIVRTMPNLGQFVGKGMTGIFFETSHNFNETEKKIVKNIFNVDGEIIELNDENQLDIITALSGSGPAYFFYFLEIFEKIAQNMGFDEKNTQILAHQTFFGVSEILKNNPKDTAQDWRKKVTSKGGTTEAAMNILKNSEFEDIFSKAIKIARKRAEELGN